MNAYKILQNTFPEIQCEYVVNTRYLIFHMDNDMYTFLDLNILEWKSYSFYYHFKLMVIRIKYQIVKNWHKDLLVRIRELLLILYCTLLYQKNYAKFDYDRAIQTCPNSVRAIRSGWTAPNSRKVLLLTDIINVTKIAILCNCWKRNTGWMDVMPNRSI